MSDAQKNEKSEKYKYNFAAFARRLAMIEFEQWKFWASQILESENISEERAERWRKIMATPWDDLPDEIKQLDYRWASATLTAFEDDPFVSLVVIAEFIINQLDLNRTSTDEPRGKFVQDFIKVIEASKSAMNSEEKP